MLSIGELVNRLRYGKAYGPIFMYVSRGEIIHNLDVVVSYK